MKRKIKQAPSPVQYRSLERTARTQWAILILMGGLVWLLWPSRDPTPPLFSGDRTNWEGFLAISYGKIGTGSGPADVSPDRFREHMQALSDSGYHPITLEEALGFLLGRAPLPEKAILLMFDEGWRDTAENAEEVLLKLRYPALFLLRLEAIENSDIDFSSWHALRGLAATGRWSLGVLSPHSPGKDLTEQEEEKCKGRKGVFTRKGESWARILADRIPGWTRSALALSRAGPAVPTKSFPIVFSRRGYALNHRGCRLDGLTRLTVSPAWTGEDLIYRLQCHGVRRSTFRGGGNRDWVLIHGRLSTGESQVTLEPVKGRGAEAWLGGTEHWQCVRGKAVIQTRPEVQAWIYLRSMPGGDFLRLGWTGIGIEVQASIGGGIRSIARGRLPKDRREATISFDLLEQRIRFTLEAGEFPRRSFPVPEKLKNGMAGLAIWYLQEVSGDPVEFRDLDLEPRLPRASLVRGMEDVRSSMDQPTDVFAPLCYRLAESVEGVRFTGATDMSLTLLASYRGGTIWPVVSLLGHPPADSLPELAREMEEAARSPGTRGILLDLRPGREAGRPLDLEYLKNLLDVISIPVGLIPDRQLGEIAGAVDLEKIARIVVMDSSGALPYVPPERLLIARDL